MQSVKPIRVVLAGGGHAHLLVLKNWFKRWQAFGWADVATEIILVSEFATTIYSGMVPGYIGGMYKLEECRVDLPRFAEACGAKFYQGEICALDLPARELIFRNGERLNYDLLSFDLGSRSEESLTGALPVKPLQKFIESWHEIVKRAEDSGKSISIEMVGGGAAGVELALAMAARLESKADLEIFERADRLLPQMPKRASEIAAKVARKLRVSFQIGTQARKARADNTQLADFRFEVTGPRAPNWLRQSSLILSEQGFIRVGADLRAEKQDRIFAVGDCAEFTAQPLPRSGVFAVRQAPVLLVNLQKSVLALPLSAELQIYRPQKRALYLLRLGNRGVLLVWGPIVFAARWLWYLKSFIDRRYMGSLQRIAKKCQTTK